MKPPVSIRPWLVALWALVSLGIATACLAGRFQVARSQVSRNADAAPNLDGQWMIDPRESGEIHLTLRVELGPGSQISRSEKVPPSRVEGLSPEDLAGPSHDVAFRLRRDAGSFVCEGRAARGRGAGVFRLELDQSFASELRRRGVEAPTPYQQAELAIAGVGLELVDELRKRGAQVELDDLVTMGHHGVDLEYVRGMAAHGFAPSAVHELVKLRDHGVDPEFIEGMGEMGYRKLSLDELLRARDHGAGPEYARGLQRAGFGRMPLDELIRLRDHGVDGEYVAAMSRAGLGRLTPAQLVTARDHGVDAEFVAEMEKSGYGDADLEMLIRARDHGVDADFARRARARLGRAPSLERLIEMRDRGELDG